MTVHLMIYFVEEKNLLQINAKTFYNLILISETIFTHGIRPLTRMTEVPII